MTNRSIAIALAVFVAIIGPCNAYAQANAVKSRIEAERIAFLTSYVNLTPDEAEAFWPIYNEFQGKLEARRSTPIREGQAMNEQEAAEQIDRHFDQEQQQLDLKKEYMVKFRSVLSAKKTYLLFEGERKFKARLLRIMNERRRKQQK